MKNIFSTLTLFSLVVWTSYAQVVPSPTSVDVNNLTIKKISNSNTIVLFDNSEKIIQMFGVPSSSEPFVLEMLDRVGTQYKYSNNEFITMNNKIFSFELNSNDFSLGNNNVY